MTGAAPPDPLTRHPIPGWKGTAFLKAVVDNPQIEVGDYSYYDDSRGPEHFVGRCVRYLFPFVGDRLIIGKFVAIAQGTQFIMNGANHAMDGFSTYPFATFGFGAGEPIQRQAGTYKGDIVVGNDVWIGREAVILPGISIGDGAIIGARAVVSRDVPAYAVIAGNPGRIVKRRFDDATIEALFAIRWWDWPAEAVLRHVELIRGADIEALRAVKEAM